MTAADLRQTLQSLSLSQSQLAGLLNVTPRSVTLWLSGKPIPGSVEAYLRLMLTTPMAVRQLELRRLASHNGIYTVFYESGPPGARTFGVGTLILEDAGIVRGGDIVGCKFEGTHVYDVTNGLIHLDVSISFPANVRAVFGIARPEPWSINVTTSLDPRVDFGATQLKTPSGDVIDVQYRYVGPAPETGESDPMRTDYGDLIARLQEKVEQRTGFPITSISGTTSASLYKADTTDPNRCDLNAPSVQIKIVRGGTVGITYQDGAYEELPLPVGTYDTNRVADVIASKSLSSTPAPAGQRS